MEFHFPKKSLGQNFLNSPKALADIISAADVKAGDEVLEIGPGKGVLTKELLGSGAQVTAVEKDEGLVALLKETFHEEESSGQFQIVSGDVLEFDIQAYKNRINKPYKLIANIPYYITGQIFRMFLEGNHGSDCQPSSITVLIQKEVAKRIVTEDKKESILSLSVKAYGVPQYVSMVKRGSFFPIPNVDSAILHIKDISKDFFVQNSITEEAFFKVVKAAFAHKRKTIGGNLKELYSDIAKTCEECGISPKSRAEDLELKDFACLVKKLPV